MQNGQAVEFRPSGISTGLLLTSNYRVIFAQLVLSDSLRNYKHVSRQWFHFVFPLYPIPLIILNENVIIVSESHEFIPCDGFGHAVPA